MILMGCHGQCFQCVQQSPGIPVSESNQSVDCYIFDSRKLIMHEGFFHYLLEIQLGQRLQHIDCRTRQERRIHFKRWIFSGCADEGKQTTFNVSQKGILLALVETMHLIDKNNGSAPLFQSDTCA
jgi:hypothetical protein